MAANALTLKSLLLVLGPQYIMKVSLIIAFYKDLAALGLILDAMRRQTYQNFEIVVAEDNDAPETRNFLAQHDDLSIIHNQHPDIGRTKAAAQNKAVCAATGEYVVFIDGDCIPYSTFIEGHVKLSQAKTVISGRRVNLPGTLSAKMRDKKLSFERLEHHYTWYAARYLIWEKESHYEQGFYFNPEGHFYKNIIARRKRNTQILGCNFSCYKQDFVAINGFDESYGLSILGDDTDLNWRFADYGASIKSCKNVANVFHLHHKRPVYDYDFREDLRRFNERKSAHLYFCEQGINQYC